MLIYFFYQTGKRRLPAAVVNRRVGRLVRVINVLSTITLNVQAVHEIQGLRD